MKARLKPKGTLFLNSNMVDIDPKREDISVFKIPANTIAKELGSERAINMIMLGAVSAWTKITSFESLINGLTEVIKKKNAKQMGINKKGLEIGAEYILKGR